MNIGRLARAYRWIEHAAFGRALERARFAFLHQLAESRRVLTLGEGDGRAVAKLLALAPQARVDVVESSGEMIALARRRVTNSNRVRFHQADALTTSLPADTYDGVTTLFFLDCFSESETETLIERIGAAMTPGGLWLVTDFAIPEKGWRHWHAMIWLWTMYRFFALTTGLRIRALPPIEKLLVCKGFERIERIDARAGLIRSEVWRKPSPIVFQ